MDTSSNQQECCQEISTVDCQPSCLSVLLPSFLQGSSHQSSPTRKLLTSCELNSKAACGGDCSWSGDSVHSSWPYLYISEMWPFDLDSSSSLVPNHQLTLIIEHSLTSEITQLETIVSFSPCPHWWNQHQTGVRIVLTSSKLVRISFYDYIVFLDIFLTYYTHSNAHTMMNKTNSNTTKSYWHLTWRLEEHCFGSNELK